MEYIDEWNLWEKCFNVPCDDEVRDKHGCNNIPCQDTVLELAKSFACLVTTVGLVGNLTTLLTLAIQEKMLPKVGRILLMHQTLLDAFVCIMSLGLYSQPYMWMTGNVTFDRVLCHAWHGQAVFWSGVLMSVWNVVFIAYDRFMLITHPLEHRNIRLNSIYKAFALIYVLGFVCLVPAFFFVSFENPCGKFDKCVNEYFFKPPGFWEFYGVFWFFIVYAIPITILLVLFTKIKIQLHRNTQSFNELLNSRASNSLVSNTRALTLEMADRQMTKTAIAVAIVFIISLSWDAFYCMLGFTNKIQYEFNKPFQVTGVFLATFDSCCTPFIYAASMPVFRRSLQTSFRRQVSRVKSAVSSRRRRSTNETRISHASSIDPRMSLTQSSSSAAYVEPRRIPLQMNLEDENVEERQKTNR